jgi:hypothetical protein
MHNINRVCFGRNMGFVSTEIQTEQSVIPTTNFATRNQVATWFTLKKTNGLKCFEITEQQRLVYLQKDATFSKAQERNVSLERHRLYMFPPDFFFG